MTPARRQRGMRRRVVVVFSAIAVVAAALAFLGRWEGARAADRQLAGIGRVYRTVGGVGARTPAAYRLAASFDCLLYRVGPNPYAFELCFDRYGRLVQAADRRQSTHIFWDVTYDPSLARIRVAPARLSWLLRGMDAFRRLSVPPGVLPTGLQDYGPVPSGVPYPVGG